jgi:hypothetical protein
MKSKTVNDMYKLTKDKESLLGEYPSDFWKEYLAQFKVYDVLFKNMFYSFGFFLQDESQETSEVLDDFQSAVYAHLAANDKKYSELFRVHVVDDEKYHLLDNYDIKETTHREESNTGSDVLGSRVDKTSDSIGARKDTTSDSIGARKDTATDNLGERSDTVNNTVGALTTTVTANTGKQTTDTTDKVAPFDSDDFSNQKSSTVSAGTRKDDSATETSEQTNKTTTKTGSQENSSTLNTGAQENNSTFNSGAQENSSTFNKGEATNKHDNALTEDIDFTRIGNIGVQTGADMLKKHVDFWSSYEFYTYIFKQISKDCLCLVD